MHTHTHTHTHTHIGRWVRTVALPLFEGKEISHDLGGTLSIEQAASAAEADPECCGFVRQVLTKP